MADTGVWNLSGDEIQIVYVNIGPTQGPLVVYRIHNAGPDIVSAGNLAAEGGGTALIQPGTDCDISGSPIAIGFLRRETNRSASGTYELLCCQSLDEQ
jgi:hypothetical protein